jgi:6-phosphofructokinase 2
MVGGAHTPQEAAMSSVVTLTMNPSLDIASTTDAVMPDEKLRCAAPQYDAGGGGINVARAIKHLGGDPLAIFPCGGPSGAVIGDLLRHDGVRFLALPIEGAVRENVHISDGATGKQYRFVMAGPTLSQGEQVLCLDALASVSPQPEFVVVSGSLPQGVPDDFYAQVEAIVSRMGSKLILDASGAALQNAGRGVYLMKLSLAELEMFVGRLLPAEQDRENAAQEILDQGRAEIVVVSLGKDGALVATADGQWHLPAIEVLVRSTVGAGDSMVGGIVLALSRNWPLLDAVRYGIVAATAALMRPGTQLCALADVDRLLRGYTPVARVKRGKGKDGLTSSLALSA